MSDVTSTPEADRSELSTKRVQFSFASEQRVRSRQDFVRIQKSRDRLVTRHFVMLLAAQRTPTVGRIGITVSRRVGCAVVRNRAKRLVREVYRHMPGMIPDGVDFVVIVRRPLTGMKFQDVFQEWQTVRTTLSRRAQAVLRQKPPSSRP